MDKNVKISLNNVSFFYDEKPVIDNISLTNNQIFVNIWRKKLSFKRV